MSIYDPLSEWLRGQTANRINATFGEVELVLGFGLPTSARTYAQWWENDPKHSQGKAWIESGFHTQDVNLTAETLVFLRGYSD